MMQGVIAAVFLFEGVNFWYYFFVLISGIVLTAKFKRMFADGDIEGLRWIIPGWFVVGLQWGLVFLCFFSLGACVHIVARFLLKIKGNTAGYPILLGAFAGTTALVMLVG